MGMKPLSSCSNPGGANLGGLLELLGRHLGVGRELCRLCSWEQERAEQCRAALAKGRGASAAGENWSSVVPKGEDPRHRGAVLALRVSCSTFPSLICPGNAVLGSWGCRDPAGGAAWGDCAQGAHNPTAHPWGSVRDSCSFPRCFYLKGRLAGGANFGYAHSWSSGYPSLPESVPSCAPSPALGTERGAIWPPWRCCCALSDYGQQQMLVGPGYF